MEQRSIIAEHTHPAGTRHLGQTWGLEQVSKSVGMRTIASQLCQTNQLF